MAGQDLKDFLTPQDNEKAKAKPPEQAQKKPIGRTIKLSNNKRIEAPKLSRFDTKNHQTFLIGAKGKKALRPKKKEYVELSNPPSTFIVPDFLWPKDPDEGLTERQRVYKKNLITDKDLNVKAPKVVKSNNPLGLRRYLFINEVIACKNGFYYYFFPLVLSFIFLIINVFQVAFLQNVIVSIYALINVLLLRGLIKKDRNIVLKILSLVLFLIINVFIIYGSTFIPGFWEEVYLPFALKLLLTVFGLYYFGKFYVFFLLAYHGDCTLDFGNVVQVNAGKPRSGKTSSGVQDVFALALLKWKELQYDYWSYVSREEEILKYGTRDEKLMLKEVKLSYEFYIKSPCIPCLWSNIGVFDKKGRASHKVTLEHLKGLKRLPLYSVVFFDELGATLKADDGLNRSGVEKPLDVSDMFRLGGHFLKWCVIGSEQDFNHIFIDCRRVVGFNKLILGQEWVCRPVLLWGIFKFLKWSKQSKLDKKVKKNRRYAKFMRWLESFCRGIGFRRIKYTYATNTETGANIIGASDDSKLTSYGRYRIRYIPSNLIANYDDRAYKQLYPSYFDNKIEGELHKSMHIDGLDEKSLTFVSKTEALTEKREVIYNWGSVDRN